MLSRSARLPAPPVAHGFPWAPAVQSSHALFLIDVRKPEMVSGLRAEGVFIMTNIVILTGRIARDPETRETKSGTSVTGITVVTDLANRIVRTVPGAMLEF